MPHHLAPRADRPSLRHELLALVAPRIRGSRELDSEETERERIERWHTGLDRSLPTGAVPRFDRRFVVLVEQIAHGDGPAFTSYSLSRRGSRPSRTVLYLHGGGYVAPIDPFHTRYAARLAAELDARVVLPDYPLAPEHTWRDSHDALIALAERLLSGGEEVIVAGDSAGGGLALALAQSLRDRARATGARQPDRLLLISPWVDLTESAPDTEAFSARDTWLFLGKLRAYARWWAGCGEDLARPEVSPGLGDLDGLPPALLFCGTRDTLAPACRQLADRAAASTWELTYLERPGLIHVFPLLPGVPEAAKAWRITRDFLRRGAGGR